MKRIAIAISTLALALLIGSASVAGAPEPAGMQASADWPMFRFSLDHSGYNPTEHTLKPPFELKWKFKAKSKI